MIRLLPPLVLMLILGTGALLLRELVCRLSARSLARSFAAAGILLAICVGCAFDVTEIPGLLTDDDCSSPPTASELHERLNRSKVILVHDEKHVQHQAEAAEIAIAESPAAESPAAENSAAENSAAEVAPPAGRDPSRPKWVDQPPRRVGHVDRLVVTAGPWDTVSACRDAIRDKLRDAVCRYLEEEFAARPISPEMIQQLSLSPGYIRRELCIDEYIETRDTGVGPMKQLHVLMEIDAADRQELARRWRSYERSANLLVIGAISGSVLGLLGIAWGLLQVDTWTKGYYSKRLFVGVPLLLLITLLTLLLV